MRMMKRLYNKARKAVKKRYVAKSGGRKSTGGIRVAKMAKDIMYLKSVLNPEKKRLEVTETGLTIGQVNGNGDGGFFADCTPIMGQGAGYAQRNGAGIKLHSTVWHFQFAQQASATSRVKGIIEVWEVLGDPQGGFTFRNEHFDVNPFTTVRDYNCQINPDHFMKGRCVARRRFSVLTDSVGGEKLITDVKIPIKYNKGKGKHIRFEKDTNTIANGQMCLIIRLDRGNIGAVSTLNVPDVAINTGLTCQYNRLDFYYDN